MKNNHFIRIFDLLVSGFLFFICSPGILFLCILIMIFINPVPVFISKRMGKDNREFKHYKLKSMKSGKKIGRFFFEQHRLTKLGRFIRKYHLDELLEFLNILLGKMSLVGPRPLPANLLKDLELKNRHSVLPGLTGLAQVYLQKKGYLNKRFQIYLDLVYIRKRSLNLNLNILCKTFVSIKKSVPLNMNINLTKDRQLFLEKIQ